MHEPLVDVLGAQAVIDAERPGLQVGEDAVDPRQHDVRGHLADEVGIVGEAVRAGIARPAVDLCRGAAGDGGAQKAVQTACREVVDGRQTDAPRPLLLHLDRAGDEDFALWWLRPPPPLGGSRPGATIARRSLAHSNQGSAVQPRASCFWT